MALRVGVLSKNGVVSGDDGAESADLVDWVLVLLLLLLVVGNVGFGRALVRRLLVLRVLLVLLLLMQLVLVLVLLLLVVVVGVEGAREGGVERTCRLERRRVWERR